MILAQISDTHILARSSDRAGGRRRADDLRRCVADINRQQPDAVVHTGDIVDVAEAGAYEAGEQLLSGLGAPLLVTPGNHDSIELMKTTFGTSVATTARHLDLKGWRIVLASSFKAGAHGGHFDPETLAELDRLTD